MNQVAVCYCKCKPANGVQAIRGLIRFIGVQEVETCLSILHVNILPTRCSVFAPLIPLAASLTSEPHVNITIQILELALLLLLLLLTPPSPPLAFPPMCFLASDTSLLAHKLALALQCLREEVNSLVRELLSVSATLLDVV